MAAPAIAYLGLIESFRTPALVVGAMLILGYVTGVKLQICAYLTSRYAGMRSFGKIFGIMSSIITVGAASGLVLASAVVDLSGSYTPLFLVSIPFYVVSAGLLLCLGPYPSWSTAPVEDAPQGMAALRG